jgi:ABC-2 type transport system ATP-binding protein
VANAIEVRDVSKQFVLRHTRSLKEAVVWLAKGRRGDLSEKFKKNKSFLPRP